MVPWPFSLFADFVAAAYLLGWLFCKLEVLFRVFFARPNWQKLFQGVLSLNPLSRIEYSRVVLITLAGVFFGYLVAVWLSHWFIKEWLLVIFVLLAMGLEEFIVSIREIRLLEVLVFFDRLLAQLKTTPDLFESLAKGVPELLSGIVQKRVHEAVLCRRRGMDIGKSMEQLRGINPFLDEFVLSLKMTSLQGGITLQFILSRLLSHAGRMWDRTSRILLIKDQAKPYVQFGQAAMIAGLLILFASSPVLTSVWPDRNILFLLILLLLVSGFFFYFSLQHHWLRRFLIIFIFLTAYGLYAGTIHIPIPAWIGVQTLSQILPPVFVVNAFVFYGVN